MRGIEICDPERGVFATAQPGRPGVVFDHGDVLAAGPAEVAVEVGPAGGHGSIVLDGIALEVELTALGAPVQLSGELSGTTELTLCQALGGLRGPGTELEIACLAVSARAVTEPAQEAALRRSLTISLADGGLAALAGARPAGAGGHDEEELVAVLREPEGEVSVSEALLSTEYDEAGRHRRATLELSPEGEPLRRGAGRIICGTTLEAAGLRVETAFFHWSLDGRPGLGRYEVVSTA